LFVGSDLVLMVYSFLGILKFLDWVFFFFWVLCVVRDGYGIYLISELLIGWWECGWCSLYLLVIEFSVVDFFFPTYFWGSRQIGIIYLHSFRGF